MDKIKSFFKSELSFSIVIVLMYFLVIADRTSPEFTLPSFNSAIIILCTLSIILFIKNTHSKHYYYALFVYLLICVASTFKYNSSYNFVKYYFIEEELFGLVLMMYFFRPIKKKENFFESKFIVIEYLLIAYAIVMNFFAVFVQKDSLGAYINHKNVIGAIDFIAILCAADRFLCSKKIIIKILSIPIAVWNIYMIYLEKSRAPFIGLFVLLVLLLLKQMLKIKFNKKTIIICTALMIFAVLSFCFLGSFALEFMTKSVDVSDMSLYDILNKISSGRWEIWTKEVPLTLRGDFLFGNGIDTLVLIGGQKGAYFYEFYHHEASFCHNFIVDALYSSGIVGFLFFLIFWATFIYYLKNNIKISNRNSIIICIFISLLIYYLLDTYFIWERFIPNLYFMILAKYLINEAAHEE